MDTSITPSLSHAIHSDLPELILDVRLTRIRRGIFILACMIGALMMVSAMAMWLRYNAVLSPTQMETVSPIGTSVLSVLGCFLTAGVVYLQYARGVHRLARDGQCIQGKVVEKVTAVGLEFMPPSIFGEMGLLRSSWYAVMRAFSGILPTLRVIAEVEIDGRKQRLLLSVFRDELPEGAPTDVVLMYDRDRIHRFPSPMAVGFDPKMCGLSG